MNVKMQITLASLVYSVGCNFAPATSGQISNSTVTKSLGQQIVGFNWSSSTADLRQHLTNSIHNARDMNRNIKTSGDIPDGTNSGYGLYIASDPIQSAMYGTELTCVVLKPSASWQHYEMDDIAALRGASSVLRYAYSTGILASPTKGRFDYAAVVRDLSAVDFSKSLKISFKTEGRREGLDENALLYARRALEQNDLCGVLSVFEGSFSTLFHALQAASPQSPWNSLTSLAPLLRMTIVNFSQGTFSFGEIGKTVASSVRGNTALVSKLKELGEIANDDDNSLLDALVTVASEVDEYSLATNDDFFNKTPTAHQIEILSSSGLFQVRPTSKSWTDLQHDMENGLRRRFQEWGRAHPVETQLMQQWLQELERVRLASLK